jgi:ethanolamine ammonia-lyase small subunit
MATALKKRAKSASRKSTKMTAAELEWFRSLDRIASGITWSDDDEKIAQSFKANREALLATLRRMVDAVVSVGHGGKSAAVLPTLDALQEFDADHALLGNLIRTINSAAMPVAATEVESAVQEL